MRRHREAFGRQINLDEVPMGPYHQVGSYGRICVFIETGRGMKDSPARWGLREEAMISKTEQALTRNH